MFFSRGPNKVQNPYTAVDFYKAYIADIDEDSPYYISYEQYKVITDRFHKAVMDEILVNGYEYKMPYNLGRLAIDKRKVDVTKKKTLGVDWALTNEHGKIIYYLNEHSGGYKYHFVWIKKTATTKNKTWYRFVPTRGNKRRLAKLIKSGDYDYFSRYEY